MRLARMIALEKTDKGYRATIEVSEFWVKWHLWKARLHEAKKKFRDVMTYKTKED